MNKFKKQDTLIVFALSAFSLGVYRWIWFNLQWQALVNLSPRPKLKTSQTFIGMMLVLSVVNAVFWLILHLFRAYALVFPCLLLTLILWYNMVKTSFHFRHVILEHIKAMKQEPPYFSPIFTFLFGPIYLQYKINWGEWNSNAEVGHVPA